MLLSTLDLEHSLELWGYERKEVLLGTKRAWPKYWLGKVTGAGQLAKKKGAKKVEQKEGKGKELIMEQKNIYSRAYHRVYTRTNCPEQARYAGNLAVKEWLESGE